MIANTLRLTRVTRTVRNTNNATATVIRTRRTRAYIKGRIVGEFVATRVLSVVCATPNEERVRSKKIVRSKTIN